MSLGTPINGALNLNPAGAGNPYAGILAGPAGLAQQYGQSYNNALAANQQNYNNILGGYDTVMKNVGDTLGQGGGWGVAAPAAQAIQDVYANQSGGAFQNSISRGIGNTTAASAAQRGAGLDAQKAYAGLGSQLAQTYAGYEANLGQGELGFMNSVNIPYPNGQDYSSLYQQYGATQANAQNNALLQQAQRQSYYAANGGRGPGAGGGGGGVSIAARPRGGTYGSGNGGFPSGSAGGGVSVGSLIGNVGSYGGGSLGGGGAMQNTYSSGNPYGLAGGAAASIIGNAVGGNYNDGINPPDESDLEQALSYGQPVAANGNAMYDGWGLGDIWS